MNVIYNYRQLELARESRKYTLKDVEDKVSFSYSKLSKAEKGLLYISSNELTELADIYDYPISFFSCSSEMDLVGHFYFRKKVSMSSKSLGAIIATTRIYKNVVDELLSSVDIPTYDLGSFSTENISPEDIAQRIRYQLRIHNGPIFDLIGLLENHGIIVVRMDMGPITDRFDGIASVTKSGYKVIFINSNMSNDRARFSLAHELGHLLMHIDNIPTSIADAENEANRFASELLMPEKEIKTSLCNLTFSKLGDLKRYWRVSMRAIVERAKRLQTVSEQQYRNLQIDFSRRGYSKIEPIVLPLEPPAIILDALDLHKSDLGYSDANLMQILHLNRNDYDRWFAKPKIVYLTPRVK